MSVMKCDWKGWRYREWSTGRLDCHISVDYWGSFMNIGFVQSLYSLYYNDDVMVLWRMKIQWNFNKPSPSLLKKGNGKNCIPFRNFASRRSRQGQIFHSLLIGCISPEVKASLAIMTYQEFSVMLRLLSVTSLSWRIFRFIDCAEVVLDVDKLFGPLC